MIYANVGHFRDPLKQNPKRRSASFKVTSSNDRVVCIYAPSRFNTSEQLVSGNSFGGQQNYMENKSDGNENKIILGDFNCTMGQMDRDGEIKHKVFIDVVPIIGCQNSSRMMGSGIYGEERTQFSLSSPSTIYPLAQDPG